MSPSANPSLTLTCRLDRQLAWYRGESVRYLGVEISAPARDESARALPPRPLNLALVVDASGSMSRAPIEAAKAGVQAVAERLGNDARLSIVSFDDEPTVRLSGIELGSGRGRVATAVARIQAGSSTDLCAGWLEGARCAAVVMEEDAGFRSRVVVLSDGHANRGTVDPRELAHHAEELRVRGLTSSTIGIGEGYSPIQLEAIAASGGGRMHRADTPGEIMEVLLGELAESEKTFAEDVAIEIRAPRGVTAELVGPFPSRTSGSGVRASLGSIAEERSVLAIFRLVIPSGEPGEELALRATGSWSPAGEPERRIEFEPASIAITLAHGEQNSAQARDIDFSVEVARAWQGAVVRHAVQLNRERQFELARSYVRGQITHFRRYCEGLPGGQQLVDQLETLASAIAREWDERYRQEAQLSSYKMIRREREVRAAAPASWADAMPPPPGGQTGPSSGQRRRRIRPRVED